MKKVTDPAILAKLNGGVPKRVTDPSILAQLNGAGAGAVAKPFDTTGLPIPGTQPPPGAPAIGEIPPNEHFGFSSGDTLNPLPALSAMGNNLAASIPVAGPYLKDTGEKFDAFVDNNLYRPMLGKGPSLSGLITGDSGVTTPQDVAQTNARTASANPEAVTVGRATGAIAPYMAAAEVPLLNQALGFSGPWMQRMAATLGSQFAITAADNQAHGQDPLEAAKNAVFPSAVAAPLSLLGPAGRAAGPLADAVENLKREGIPLTAGQQKGSNALMQSESQMGGVAAQNFRDKQLTALTSTALRYAGVNAKAATPAVMDKAFTDIGGKFDYIAGKTTIKADQTLQDSVIKAATDYSDLTGKANPLLERLVNQVGSVAKTAGGVIPGESYKALNTEISTAMKKTSEPELKGALGDFKEALDDGVARSMNGKTLESWQKVRQQYANLMRVTDAVAKAGGAAKAGLITPEALDQAVRASMSRRQYARGVGDLNQLSRDAVIAMPALPNSGTAARLAPYLMASAAGGIAGAGNPVHAMAGALGSLAAPAIAGRVMLSGPGRALLAKGTNIPNAVARGIGPMMLPRLPGF